jgi:hypothetical protein
MGAKAFQAGVNEFLRRFKAKAVAEGLHFVPRKQNLDGIATAGLTMDEAERIILDLTEANYSGGPEREHEGGPGEIWFFNTFEEGRNIYVELKLCELFVACRSFRLAKHLAQPPYKR